MDTYFLDIETINRRIVIVGILKPDGEVVQHTSYYGMDQIYAEWLHEHLPAGARLVTFNGHIYDLPLIRKATGVDLRERMWSVDLRWHRFGGNWKLSRGLKENEGAAGYRRKFPILTSYGFQYHWEHRHGDLHLCLGYNRDDLLATRAVWKHTQRLDAEWSAFVRRDR